MSDGTDDKDWVPQNPMQQYPAAIVLLTNPENELYKLELTLRNMRIDSKGNPQPIGTPKLNDKGIISVLGQVQSFVNQDMVMSNMDDKTIPILMEVFSDALIKDLMTNRKYYEITDLATRDVIMSCAWGHVFSCLRRAYNEGDRRFWKGSQTDVRHTVINESAKKGMMATLAGSLGIGGKTS